MEWQVYALAMGVLCCHTSIKAKSANMQLSLVCLGSPTTEVDCTGQSIKGFMIILKSPSHTAKTVGCRVINDRPAATTSELYGGGHNRQSAV